MTNKLNDEIAEVRLKADDVIFDIGLIFSESPIRDAVMTILNAAATGQLVPWPAKTSDKEANTDNDAVYQFARMMQKKMALSRANGRKGWNDPDRCSPDYLRALLYEHIYKGDPVDVANICMMLRHYQEATSPKPEDDLRLLADRDAAVGAALAEAARVLDTAGDSVVTEALGQRLCCSGHHCGCQGADVGTFLQHMILALRPDATAALERALVKAREEEQGRVVRIAAGLFPGGYDNNAARILAALKRRGGDA